MTERVTIMYKTGKQETVEMPREVTSWPDGWTVVYGVGEKDIAGNPYPDRRLINNDLIAEIWYW